MPEFLTLTLSRPRGQAPAAVAAAAAAQGPSGAGAGAAAGDPGAGASGGGGFAHPWMHLVPRLLDLGYQVRLTLLLALHYGHAASRWVRVCQLRGGPPRLFLGSVCASRAWGYLGLGAWILSAKR